MSEKVIDPHSLLELYKTDVGRSRADSRLFDLRLADEADKQAVEDRARFDRPAAPNAQLVFDVANGIVGVAIKGARRVCPLPAGYGGPHCELAMLPHDRLVVVEPDRPTLLIDPETGTTRRL